MGLTSIGAEDKVRIKDFVLKEQGAIAAIEGGVVLVSLHISNDGGEGFIHIIDQMGNRIELVRVSPRTSHRDIVFNDMQIFWKNSELRIIKTNAMGEMLVTARYITGAKIKLLDWALWEQGR